MIIRNSMGEVIDGFFGICRVGSALMAEAFALRKVVAMISSLRWNNVVFESN